MILAAAVARQARFTTPYPSDGEGVEQNSEAIRKPTCTQNCTNTSQGAS